MDENFLNLTGDQYNTWREKAEFFVEEQKIVLPLLARTAYKTVLDIGCGSGTWSRLAMQLRPGATAMGTDISPSLVRYARSKAKPMEKYLVRDFRQETQYGTFDLVISGMSADYIGFEFVARGIARSLKPSGSALVWVRDPTDYDVHGQHRIKRWTFEGKLLMTGARIFNKQRVINHFGRFGLVVDLAEHNFSLADGKLRKLLVYAISWAPRPLSVKSESPTSDYIPCSQSRSWSVERWCPGLRTIGSEGRIVHFT